MPLVRVTPPGEAPVSLEEAKEWCAVTGDDDNARLIGLINTATLHAETSTRRALMTQVWDYFASDFPRGNRLALPKPPLQSVASVKYTPDAGSETTFAVSNYIEDTAGEPGAVVLNVGASWPTDALVAVNGVAVRFTAGFGATGDLVPETIRTAILMLVAHWNENREVVIVGTTANRVPQSFDALLFPEVAW